MFTMRELWANNGLNGIISGLSQRGVGIAGNTAREKTMGASLTNGIDHIRRGARGSNAQQGVVRGGMMGQKVFPPPLSNILSMLHGMAQSLVATSDDARHPIGGHAKRGGQFAGIEHTQTTTGTSTDIEESSATFHPRLNGLDKCLNLGQCQSNSLSHQRILFVDVLQQFTNAHLLQMVVT